MDNNFTGTIPHQLGNLTNLRILTLNYNSLVHEIPKSFRNLTQLQILYININYGLGEPLADFFGKLSCNELEKIDISFNQYTGPIPDLGACSKLKYLALHHNLLSGSLPASLGQLTTLGHLDVNFLQGTISETLFSKLDKLYQLDLSFNSLTLDFSPGWIPPFSLIYLSLATCKMGPSFPAWLQTQTRVSFLDISDNGISDRVPHWLWSLSPKLTNFNISQNQITGTIPHDLSSNFFGMIDVSSNNFSGPLPLLHPNITLALFSLNMFTGSISFVCQIFSSQLVLLDLSDNQLGGVLPNCWNNTRALKFLNLNNNNFNGEIPHAIGHLWRIETLHLRGNNLSGQLPPTLRNCRNLLLVDIGGNNLTGNVPPWLGEEFPNMTHLSLRQNRFYGEIPPKICDLTHIQMLDISGNDISGTIPPCFDNFTPLVDNSGPITNSLSYNIDFRRDQWKGRDSLLVQWKGRDSEYRKALPLLKLIDLSSNRLVGNIPEAFSNLKGLISLNLSRNRLAGMIDPNIGRMKMLESLDLSNNQLSGEIPIGLAQLSYLAVLDLANNNFTGQIPTGTQLQSFNASTYSGNNELCGAPLPSCLNTTITNQAINNKDDDGGFLRLSSLPEFVLPLILGFIVGFWGVVASLVLKRSWRIAYFGFIDAVGDWLYITAAIFYAKFRPS